MSYEPMTSFLFSLACQRPGSVIDGGAADGHFSKLAIASGKKHNVYAFEPRKSEYEKLRPLEPHIIAVNSALWSAPGMNKRLYYAEVRRFTASFKPELWKNSSELVDTIAMDGWFFNTTIAVIKLDIEGSEPEAIIGGAGLIRANAPVIFVEVLNDAIGSEIQKALPIPYTYHRIFDDTMSVKLQESLTVGNDWGNFMLTPKN